jgi:hypothetical protein
VSHLIIYSPVILSYEVEDPVNTVGGAILSVHLLAAPFTQDHRYCPEQGVSYLLADITTDQSRRKNGSMVIRSLRVQHSRWMLIDSFRSCEWISSQVPVRTINRHVLSQAYRRLPSFRNLTHL